MGRRYDTMRHAAFEAKGREWSNVIVTWEAIRMAAPYVAGAALLGTLGWLGYAGWHALTGGAAHTDDAAVPVATTVSVGAVPGWLWITAVALAGTAVALFRPGRIMTGRERQRRWVYLAAIVIALAGLAGLGLSMATG